MAPHLAESRIKLGYPLYAADFDPLNPDFLLVGGGGGSSSTGVPNKITLLDVSRPYESAEVNDIELAKDEDAVTTLAVASSSDTSLSAIAGINSSLAEQQAGRNEHLRFFRVGLPTRKRNADGTEKEIPRKPLPTQALGKSALFASAHGEPNELYQRVLRASPIQASNEPRITAIASGLAPENEVVAFQPVSNALTSAVDEVSRISLGKKEAADVDIMAVKGTGHVLAYCTEDSVYIQDLPNTKGSQIDVPKRIYQCPSATDGTPANKRPKFRCLRFLTPKHILLLQNRAERTGASLLILKISITGTGYIMLTKRLNKAIKLGVGLDTAILRCSSAEEYQVVIAVASQDSSVEVLAIDHTPLTTFSKYTSYTVLRDVHSGPLTRLVFSNFIPPTPASSKDKLPQQRLKLASVGLDQIVTVHTLPLRPHKQRHVLISPSGEAFQNTISIFAAIFVVIIAALLTQAFCEIRGALPPSLGVVNYLPASVREKYVRPYLPQDSQIPSPTWASSDSTYTDASSETDTLPPALSSALAALSAAPSQIPTALSDLTVPEFHKLPTDAARLSSAASSFSASLASDLSSSATAAATALTDLISSASSHPTAQAIIMRDPGPDSNSALSAALHPADAVSSLIAHPDKPIKAGQEKLKNWSQLTPQERKTWKQKLSQTGHWVEQQGENVLKGILFGELAGAVAQAAQAAAGG